MLNDPKIGTDLSYNIIFAKLSGCQYFSKFDFCKGHWQVIMRDEDKDVTTFVTHRGLFRFRVMPFGLVNAPATFSRIMRKLLEGLRQIENYLDDVLDYTKFWPSHLQTLRQFFYQSTQGQFGMQAQ